MAHQIQIVLLGKSGHGKSATGNTILNRLHFPESPNLTSLTKMVERGIAQTSDSEIHVFDTPGPFDTDFNGESIDLADLERTFQNMEMLMRSCSVKCGVTAFFLVFNVTCKFSREELKTIEVLEKIFGDTVFTEFGVLVFTHGDNFTGDFTQFCQAQTGEVGKFIKKFQNRRILISNKGSFTDERSTFGAQMISMALLLKQSHRGYTVDKFNSCEQNRLSLIMEHRIKKLAFVIDERREFDKQTALVIKEQCEKLQTKIEKKIEEKDLKNEYIDDIKELKIELRRKTKCTIL